MSKILLLTAAAGLLLATSPIALAAGGGAGGAGAAGAAGGVGGVGGLGGSLGGVQVWQTPENEPGRAHGMSNETWGQPMRAYGRMPYHHHVHHHHHHS